MDENKTLELDNSDRILILQMRMDTNEVKVNELYKTVITGDTVPSHKESIRNLMAYTDTLKFWSRAVALAILGQTITFGATAVIYFLKLYPLLIEITNKQQP